MNTITSIGTAPLVELRRVTRHYQIGENPVIALKGIDITIQAREFVAIWGRPGPASRPCATSSGCSTRPPRALC
ncbi:hypothetical protein ACFSHR_04460 [Azotobacter chroococcum]